MSKKREMWKSCKCCAYMKYYPEVDSVRTCGITGETVGGTIFKPKIKTWDRCDEYEPMRVCATCARYDECVKKTVVIADKTTSITVYQHCYAWVCNKDIKKSE